LCVGNTAWNRDSEQDQAEKWESVHGTL
jgi:hypothetical protein